MKNLEFYKCEKCGEIKVEFETKNEECCENMTAMIPNTVDAAFEKHVPVLEFDNDFLKVKVGSVMHPMTKEHLITNIYVVTDNGLYIEKTLTENDKPEYTFKIDDAKKADVYALCNLHGVWKSTITR